MGPHAAPVLALLLLLCAPACLGDDALRHECDGDSSCAPTERCVQRLCVGPATLEAAWCEAGETLCGDACVNLATDIAHCGACGVQCVAAGQGSAPFCVEGACISACDVGFYDLDDEPGCERRCTDAERAAAERCDGEDNDCDGLIDEADLDYAEPCALSEGLCAGAVARCTDGEPVACDALDYAPAGDPAWERGRETRCDGVDNDCDGEADEDCCTADAGASPLSPGIAGEMAALDDSVGITFLADGRLRRWRTPAWSAASLMDDRSAPGCPDGAATLDAVLGAELIALRCRGSAGDALVDPQSGIELAALRTNARLTGSASSTTLLIVTWRESSGLRTDDRWAAWPHDDPGAVIVSTWPEALAQPLSPAVLNDELALLVADPVAGVVAAHPLDAEGRPEGRRNVLLDSVNGLVAGAPLPVAAPRDGWLAYGSGEAGRTLFARPLGDGWGAPAAAPIPLGQASGTVESLRWLQSTDDAPALAAVTEATLELRELLDAGVAARVISLPGSTWRAAIDADLLILATASEPDEPWQLRRYGRDGGRLCP